MTREEILAKRIITFPEEGHMLDSDIKRNVYAAMSEFAQQEAIAFAEWVNKRELKLYNEGWCNPGGSNGFHYTTTELYQLFKTKQP